MTFGDCPVTDCKGGRRSCRRSSESGRQRQEVSNLNPATSKPRCTDRVPILVWTGAGWTRFHLNSNVGRVLSRRGTLPTQYRSKATQTPQTLSLIPSAVGTTYADAIRHDPMTNYGAGRRMQGAGRGGVVRAGAGRVQGDGRGAHFPPGGDGWEFFPANGRGQ